MNELTKKEILEKIKDQNAFEILEFYENLNIEFKNDLDIVKACSFGRGLYDVLNETLQNNKEVILSIMEKRPTFDNYSKLKPEFKKDPDIIKVTLKSDGSFLEFLDQKVKNNKEMVKVAVSAYGPAIQYASDTLKNDWDVVSIALEENIHSIFYMGESYLEHPEKAIVYNFSGFICASEKIKSNNPRHKSLETIKNNLLINKNKNYIQKIMNQFLNVEKNSNEAHISGWKTFVNKIGDYVETPEFKINPILDNLNKELRFHFSYLLPHWPLNVIHQLNKDLDTTSNLEIKNLLQIIFKQELIRRKIQDISLPKNENKTKKKNRKLNF
jgi:hypothetical protein